MSLLAGRIATLGTENAFKLGADIQRCVERGMEVIKFNLGEPDFDSAAHINREAIAQIEAGNSHYCDPAGLLGLRETIARHVSATREIEVDPGRVVVTTGGKPPIGYTFQTYVDPGDEIIYPSPGFPIYESWVTFVGAVPVPLQLSEDSGFGFTADELAALITERTKLIILCSPSNPTGGVVAGKDLGEIAAVIRERCRPEVRIYSDEIYEHILFDGETHHSIVSHSQMPERTVLVSGHSKGLRDDRMATRLRRAADPRGGGDLQTAQHQHCFLRAGVHPGGRPRGLRKPRIRAHGERDGERLRKAP